MSKNSTQLTSGTWWCHRRLRGHLKYWLAVHPYREVPTPLPMESQASYFLTFLLSTSSPSYSEPSLRLLRRAMVNMGQVKGSQVKLEARLQEATQREPLKRELQTPSQWEKLTLGGRSLTCSQ